MRFIAYDEIRAALRDTPILLTEHTLIRAKFNLHGLPFIREAGPRSRALWDCETFLQWFARKYRGNTELIELVSLRLRRETVPHDGNGPTKPAPMTFRAKAVAP